MVAAGCSSSGGGDDDDDDDNGGDTGKGGTSDAGKGGSGMTNGGSSGAGGSTGGSGATGGCSSNADCSGIDVCDPRTGACVECVRTGDCTGTNVCIDLTCVEPDTCSGPSDCADDLYCDTGAGACVECLMDSHCGVGETCAESTCVPDITGTGGTGNGGTGNGDAGMGADGGTSSSTGGTGGTDGGTGGTNGGTGGSNGGTGGGGNECTCSGSQECTVQGDCVDPDTVEDFSDCDETIIEVRGRSGTWYADGDTGINVMYAVSKPGSAWADDSCAAWTTGGPTGSGSTQWGVLGVAFADGSAYDLSDYSGISVRIETGASIGVNLTTTDGGNFMASVGATTGSKTYNLSFANDFPPRQDSAVQNLNLTKVKEIQFTPDDASIGYGIAVHAIYLQ